MTTEQALRTAAGRVHVIHLGHDQYQVNTWSELHQAWYDGNICNRAHALHTAWEDKVGMALCLLGVDDAEAIANSAVYNVYPLDWRQCVRNEVRIAFKYREAA